MLSQRRCKWELSRKLDLNIAMDLPFARDHRKLYYAKRLDELHQKEVSMPMLVRETGHIWEFR